MIFPLTDRVKKTLAAEAKAEAERKAAEEEARRKAAEEEEARKNAIAPIKEEITIDEFDKVDMRVYVKLSTVRL
ncbi:MAG: hypothetical protein ACLVIY_06125 [Anaerobutyricum soehngenii]